MNGTHLDNIEIINQPYAFPELLVEPTNLRTRLTDSAKKIFNIISTWMVPWLNYAIQMEQKKAVQFLIFLGADVTGKTVGVEQCPLKTAVKVGNASIVKLLLESGANVEAPHYMLGIPIFSSSPVRYAVNKENVEVVKVLIDGGACVDQNNQSIFGESIIDQCLHYSRIFYNSLSHSKMSDSKLEIIKYILENRDVKIAFHHVFTAYQNIDIKLFKLLMEHVESDQNNNWSSALDWFLASNFIRRPITQLVLMSDSKQEMFKYFLEKCDVEISLEQLKTAVVLEQCGVKGPFSCLVNSGKCSFGILNYCLGMDGLSPEVYGKLYHASGIAADNIFPSND